MRLDPESLHLFLSPGASGKRETGRYVIPLEGLPWDLPDAVPGPDPGTLEVAVTASGDTVLVEGTFQAVFLSPCARCLENAVIPITGEVRRVYTSDPDFAEEPEVELGSLNEGWISILDAVREAVLLSMPLTPLCKEDCRGLCSECGANWNAETCPHGGGSFRPLSAQEE